MESKNLDRISINIPNYNGPLEVLLDLAKTQKVNLAEISIAQLADQFLAYIKNNENLNLEEASEFLLMATWLAYLKSKLLLPEDENDDFKALEIAEKLKPSKRGELEITDLNNEYLKIQKLDIEFLGKGFAWLDTGTPDALLEASNFVKIIETRQGLLLGDPSVK